MLGRYSLSEIVHGQTRTICEETQGWSRGIGMVAFFGVPAVSPLLQYHLGLHLTEDLVSIIVSAASIFAGLLLNLLVVIYGFAPHAEGNADKKTQANIEKLVEYCFYNISYAILVSGLLVVFALMFLTGLQYVKVTSELLVYYFGFQLFLCIVQILKRCHSLLNHRLTRDGKQRSQEAKQLWGASNEAAPPAPSKTP